MPSIAGRTVQRHRSRRGARVGAILIAAGIAGACLNQKSTASHLTPPVSTSLINPLAATFEEEVEEATDLIDQLIETLGQGATTVAGSVGPLSEPSRSSLAADLDAADDLLVELLDPTRFPSLNPANGGAIQASVAPTTLVEYADASVGLALDARQELEEGSSLDPTFFAMKLKTLQHLLNRSSPHNYRTKAGIN